MWSQREQIQAYQFVRRRTVSAFLVGDANAPRSPVRRTNAALLAGGLVLVLLLGGFAVYGFLRPGSSTAWRKDGAIVEEKETGARFVRGADGALRPVLNYTSARLLTGGDGKLTRVSRKSLAAAGRGPAVGIPGAPDALPPPNRLLRDPWQACSSESGSAGPGQLPQLTVIVGPPADKTRILLSTGAALVVRSAGQTYVVTDGRRLRVPARPGPILDALGLTEAPRIDVEPRWLATLPPGPDLGYPAISGRGEPGVSLGSGPTRVGQVFRQRVAGSEVGLYFVMLRDGLALISTTQARLILGDPRTTSVYEGRTPVERPLSPAALAGARSTVDLGAARFPRRAPAVPDFSTGDDVVVCSSPRGFTEGIPSVAVYLAFAVPVPDGAVAGSTGPGTGGAAPARVIMRPGSGALVRRIAVPGVTTGAVYLVTDDGRRYPVADSDSLSALGFGAVDPVAVPARFLDVLDTGPTLSRAAAAAPAPAAPVGPADPGGSAPPAGPGG